LISPIQAEEHLLPPTSSILKLRGNLIGVVRWGVGSNPPKMSRNKCGKKERWPVLLELLLDHSQILMLAKMRPN